MNQNRIQSKPTKSFLQFMIEIRAAGSSLLAAVAFGLSAFFVRGDCSRPRNMRGTCRGKVTFIASIKRRSKCQWTASGIGDCALNPRLLFPNDPRDSDAEQDRSKEPLSWVIRSDLQPAHPPDRAFGLCARCGYIPFLRTRRAILGDVASKGS